MWSKSLGKMVHVAVVVFLGFFPFFLASFLGLSPERGHDASSLATMYPWLRWDSFHYLSVASSGYKAAACGQYVCGNTGWFPLYPLLIRIFSILLPTVPIYIAAQFVSILAFCMQVFFWRLVFGKHWSYIGFAFAMIVLPGGIYQISAFPLSTALMFYSAGLLSFTRRSYIVACMCMSLSALSYPSALLLGFGGLPFAFRALESRPKKVGLFALIFFGTLASSVAGYVFARYVIDLSSGVHAAYQLTASRYGLAPSFGFDVLRSSLKYFWRNAIYMQTAAVFLMASACLLFFCRANLWRDPLCLGIIISAFLCWLPPHLLGDSVSIYRQETLLQPLFMAAAIRLPRKALFAFAVPLSILAYLMFRKFISGELV